jgi:integrase
MGQRKTPGLTKRGGVWHIDKWIGGTRVCESTGTGDLPQAQEHLAKRVDDARTARLYGVRGDHTFRAAATKFLTENQHKRSIGDDAMHLRQLDPYIGAQLLRQVHSGTLQAFIAKRRSDGVKTKTINAALAVVRRILNLSASEWMDDRGMTWLEHAPKIRLLPVTDARKPYPLSGEEQSFLFPELPDYLAQMALFKVNTGTREQEVCGLKWSHEVKVPELDASVFVIPAERVKNGEERLVVLNRVARSIINSLRGKHPDFVFVREISKGESRPLTGMNGTAWQSARERAARKWAEEKAEPAPEGFRRVRVHDLKHTFGRRLRAAGVSFEDRQDLLGHKSGRMTTHYSQAELSDLISAAEKVCDSESRKSPATTWLRRKSG